MEEYRYVVDTRSGQRGTAEDFVNRFAELWAAPNGSAQAFGQLLASDIKLIAPMTPTTRDRDSGVKALQKVLDAAPDLHASVLRWAEAEDAIFIEMEFTGTIGGRVMQWRNVDRFRFTHGEASERVAYFDPLALQRGLLRSPRGWVQLAKLVLR